MGNVVWGRFPERIMERAALRGLGDAISSPTSIGENHAERSADRFLRVSRRYQRARFVLGFVAGIFFIVGWWPLAVLFLFSAIFGRRPK